MVHVQPHRLAILEDLWSYEAEFAATKHRAILAYLQAYRHATDLGPEQDMFLKLNQRSGPKAFPGTTGLAPPAGPDPWEGVGANSKQPELLAARRQLRRELIDLCFRWGHLAGCWRCTNMNGLR